jgi:1,4-alpha-glucan branching enzyme
VEFTSSNRSGADSSSDSVQLTENDVILFRQGRHYRLYDKLGSHPARIDGADGVHFAVWAPNATSVSVIGDFNGWRRDVHPLQARHDESGIWSGFVQGAGAGTHYKYYIRSRHNGYAVDKADPFARRAEIPPQTASIVDVPQHVWGDAQWMRTRAQANALNAPMSVYEMHLGSWRRDSGDGHRLLNYRELAKQLPDYLREMGFTHVELMPLTEHPFYGSWGYQTTGYFAATGRYGSPQDLQYLIDCLHQAGIGVILDWVPSHFPTDEHGLGYFDGTHLYEHPDRRRGFHPEWNSIIFDYGRAEVRSFLISSALYWLEHFHIDGLRVDAVASMLYLDYARKPGEWLPNEHGGRENLEAIGFLRELNDAVYTHYPDVQTIAEESTAWPKVSRAVADGGLGFGLKWNMGWMHDTLNYFAQDPVHRKHHHDRLSFGIWYAFNENFMLPFSHDEVVYGKGSLLRKMPGDPWQRFANLRLLLGFQHLHPGKKLLFMGSELGQWNEWNHDAGLDWSLQEQSPHRGIQRLVQDLNRLHRDQPALHRHDFDSAGFEWVDLHDAERCVLSFLRKGDTPADQILAVCNFTPVPRPAYRVGVPLPGRWTEVLNSDAAHYGGSGVGNLGGLDATTVASHQFRQSLLVSLPPLAIVCFRPEAAGA